MKLARMRGPISFGDAGAKPRRGGLPSAPMPLGAHPHACQRLFCFKLPGGQTLRTIGMPYTGPCPDITKTMQVQSRRFANAVVLLVSGRLDQDTCDGFRTDLMQHVEAAARDGG